MKKKLENETHLLARSFNFKSEKDIENPSPSMQFYLKKQ